jgi:putative endonuclease
VKRDEGLRPPPDLRIPWERRYWVYFLASKNRETLYIGVTADLGQRLREHREPAVDSTAFTTIYHTVDLVYYEAFDGIEIAIAREKQLKGWRREKKDALVAKLNPRWEDLSVEFERELPKWNDSIAPEDLR